MFKIKLHDDKEFITYHLLKDGYWDKYKTELYGGDMSMADFKKELKRINQLNITNPFKNL